jgi:hypothetical protein
MEEIHWEHTLHSESELSELSTIDEEQYTNISTAEIDVDTSSEYSPENYLPSYTFGSIQNEVNEEPLTLPIEYLATAREILISLVMTKKQISNEALTFTNNTNASSLSEPISVSMDNLTLSGSETWLDPQLQNYTFSPLVETPPPQLSIEQLLSSLSSSLEQNTSTSQSIPTITQNSEDEPMDNIVFDNIDSIITHSRPVRNGRRIRNMLCSMKNGEQRWFQTKYLRKDSRISGMMDRYYRDKRYPYWAKRTNKGKRK